MNNTLYILFISLITVSCGQNIETEENSNHSNRTANKTETDSLQSTFKHVTPIDETSENEIKRYQRTSNLLDSHNFLALEEAYNLVKKKIHLDKYYKKLIHQIPNSPYEIQISIYLKKMFANHNKHLIIRRGVDEYYNVNIYNVSGKEIIPVLKFELEDYSYMGDTIFDVNGDNINDFLVNWHAASGCCPRDSYSVFVTKKNGSFENKLNFINPTFYPKEKKILGMTYGHIGAVSLYKFKWKGTEIDTIEYIYKDTNSNNKYPYFKTKKEVWLEDTGTIVPLEKIPKEYIGIGND